MVVTAASLFTLPSILKGEDIIWTGANEGNYADSANWNPQNVPDTVLETAVFQDFNGTVSLPSGSNINVGNLSIRSTDEFRSHVEIQVDGPEPSRFSVAYIDGTSLTGLGLSGAGSGKLNFFADSIGVDRLSISGDVAATVGSVGFESLEVGNGARLTTGGLNLTGDMVSVSGGAELSTGSVLLWTTEEFAKLIVDNATFNNNGDLELDQGLLEIRNNGVFNLSGRM
jgi:hypothetical protein